MAKEFKRSNSSNSDDKRSSDHKKSSFSKKGKKPSFERKRDDSRPSDFGSGETKRAYSGRSDEKRKPFADKPAFRKKRDDDQREEKPSFNKEEKSGFDKKRKPFGDKPSFPKKRYDNDRDEKPTFKKKNDDDFYESKPSFVRESDKKEFDYDSDDAPKKSKSSYSDYKKRGAEGKTDKKFDREPSEKPSFKKEEGGDENRSRPFKKNAYERKPYTKKTTSKPQVTSDREGLRLNKYISNAGICSRREADELIATGVVSVNGKIITEMGYRVNPTDVIKYGGQTLRKEKLVYLILNKPKDYIVTVDDPQKRKTVLELVQGACRERIYPVGRLDRATTGLLMFTNDGELTKKLTHPRYGVRKIYHVELDKPLKRSDLDQITAGIELEDGEIKVDEISYVGDAKDKSIVGVELHSGKNRIVRRIFEHLGYNVRKLDRVMFGPLTKKDMPRGRWRMLTEAEVGMLKMISSEK